MRGSIVTEYIVSISRFSTLTPRPSPKGRGETKDSLSLWERAGVRVI